MVLPILTKRRAVVLAADVGGTNTRFGLFTEEKGKILLLRFWHYATADAKSFASLVRLVLQDIKKMPIHSISRAAIAVAGSLHQREGKIHLANAPWDVTIREIEKMMAVPILWLNDLQAAGYGIACMEREDIITLKQGKMKPREPKIVVGAGTGLGKALLLWNTTTQTYKCFHSEGGHTDFAAQNGEEWELVRFLHQKGIIKPSWEDVISGKGLQHLYLFLGKKRTYTKTPYSHDVEQQQMSAELISLYRRKDAHCRDAFRLLVRFLARYARNAAIDGMAFGGIYITGGIAAKNSDLLLQKEFKEEFLANRYMKPLLQEMPVFVVCNQNVGLYGAARAAFDYGGIS